MSGRVPKRVKIANIEKNSDSNRQTNKAGFAPLIGKGTFFKYLVSRDSPARLITRVIEAIYKFVFSQKLINDSNPQNFGYSTDMTNNYVVVGDIGGGAFGTGAVSVYKNNSGTWSKTNTFEGVDNPSVFGYSVSMTNNYIFVGDYNGGADNSGNITVYYNNNGTWEYSESIDGLDNPTNFGSSVSITDNFAIVGDIDGGADNSGNVNIYKNNSGTWNHLHTFESPIDSSKYGHAVAITDEYAIVGDNDGVADSSGDVTIYKNNSGIWSFSQSIKGISTSNRFGYSVAISETYFIVGDINGGINNNGQAIIYKNNNGTWEYLQTLEGDENSTFFGRSVSITDNFAIVGDSNGGSDNGGNSFVYKNNNGRWEFLQKIEETSDHTSFGISVAITDSYAAIGDNNGRSNNKGFVNIYDYKRIN